MRHLLKTARQTVVVDFSRGSIKLASAETAGEAVRFRGITKISVAAPGDDQQTELGDSEIAELIRAEVKRHGWTGMPAACLLSRSATSTQSFVFPPMPDADLREAIELKLRQTLHFNVEDAFFDFRRIQEPGSKEGDQVLTLVVAARKDAIRRALTVLRQAGLRPVAVGAASESLANLTYYASLCDEGEATIHVDIGTDSTILNLFEGHLLRFSREVDIAGATFTQALMRPIITTEGPKHLTQEQAEEVKVIAGYPRDERNIDLPHGVKSSEILPLMEPVAQRLAAEIRRSIDYLRGILGRSGIDRIIISGSGARMRNLSVVLEQILETPVLRIDPVARAMAHWRLAICGEQLASTAGFSAILGYSLGNHRPINLLPREERIRNVVERVASVCKVAAPCAIALALWLALAAVPIQRNYGTATQLMQRTSDKLEHYIQTESAIGTKLEQALLVAQQVASVRGPVLEWTGIMKELAAILPAEVQIESLSATRNSSITLYLDGRIHLGAMPSNTVIEQATNALGTSPFFTNVRVIDASAASAESPGSFQTSFEIVAPPIDLELSKP